jgi:magnesium-transporting ATPase (P-type)
MTFRSTPLIATWILNQFGAVPENESAIGDLVEKYQRGKGSIWYWRQVLVIIFAGLVRDVRREQRQFLKSLFRTWCVWGALQLLAGVLVMMRYNSLHPLRSDRGLATNLLPLVTIRVLTANDTRVWDVGVLMVILNILTPLLVGRYIASSSKVHPRSLLLACATSFVVMDIGLIVTHVLLIYLNHPIDIGFLITDLIALPLLPTLLLIGGIGGTRGLSALSPQIKR